MTTPAVKHISFSEIAKHVTESDLWFVKDRKVYDITKFVDLHPGGVDTLLGVAGKDGTADFNAVGHSDTAIEELHRYYIGDVDPEDADKLPAASQEAKSSVFTYAVVIGLIAVFAFFIFYPQ